MCVFDSMGKIKRWTQQEFQYIDDHSGEDVEQIAHVLGRSKLAVQQIIWKGRAGSSSSWKLDHEKWLKENANKFTFAELMIKTNRSMRSLQYKMRELNLFAADSKRPWSEEEQEIIITNQHKTAEELRVLLPGRTQLAISQMAEKLRGTARRQFKIGWAVPSKELAYFLGALVSDGSVTAYSFSLTQDKSHEKFYNRVRTIIESVFGIPVSSRVSKTSWLDQGVKKTKELVVIHSCSTEFSKYLGYCGDKGDWVGVLNDRFAWIWQEEFFWSFIGGLYDGDGCLRPFSNGKGVLYGSVEIAITPVLSREFVRGELLKRGFEFKEARNAQGVIHKIVLNTVEEVKLFLENVDSVLSEKRDLSFTVVKKSVELQNGVAELSYKQAFVFLVENHYLGTLPAVSYSLGWFEEGILKAVVAFSKTSVLKGLEGKLTFEIVRFASVSGKESSQILAGFIKEFRLKRPEVKVIVTFADDSVGHKGVLYQALNAFYLGGGAPVEKWIGPNGRVYGGRFSDRTMDLAGVRKEDCERRIVRGKHKYAWGFDDESKVLLKSVCLPYPKQANVD